jgi:hypothetical protein
MVPGEEAEQEQIVLARKLRGELLQGVVMAAEAVMIRGKAA